MANCRNPFLLAADNSPAPLPLLRGNPTLASVQDEHGYSLVHVAASYNHLDLLRTLVREFCVDVNLKDEDDETALFVETVDAARVLVEDLSADFSHKGSEGLTAAEKIEAEGDFPAVAAYLGTLVSPASEAGETAAIVSLPQTTKPPPLEGMNFTMSTLDPSVVIPNEIDPGFRQRVELARRDDFDTPQGQADLRKLVEDALVGQVLAEERNVHPKHA